MNFRCKTSSPQNRSAFWRSWDPRLDDATADTLFNQHQRSLQYLLAAYPVDSTQVRMEKSRVSKQVLDIDSLTSSVSRDLTVSRILARLTRIVTDINKIAPTPDRQFDRVVLLLERKPRS